MKLHVGSDGSIATSQPQSCNVNFPYSTGTPLTSPWTDNQIQSERQKMDDIIRQIEIERITKGIKNVPLVMDPSVAIADYKDDRIKGYHLKYKGITFKFMGPIDMAEFFDNLKDITLEELRVFEVTYPQHYSALKEAWVEAWTKIQGSNAFESD